MRRRPALDQLAPLFFTFPTLVEARAFRLGASEHTHNLAGEVSAVDGPVSNHGTSKPNSQRSYSLSRNTGHLP
jgi:hypothetical protein